MTTKAKMKGYSKGRFSFFNVHAKHAIKVEMHFLPGCMSLGEV